MSKPDFIFTSYALKSHLEKDEQKFDIGSYLKIKNEETDKLFSSLNSDISSLELFQKINYIKDIYLKVSGYFSIPTFIQHTKDAGT